AEDGIRDFHVTGVQTCALPISAFSRTSRSLVFWKITRLLRWPKASRYKVSADHFKKSKPVRSRMKMNPRPDTAATYAGTRARRRSEERRVGKKLKAGARPLRDT